MEQRDSLGDGVRPVSLERWVKIIDAMELTQQVVLVVTEEQEAMGVMEGPEDMEARS